MNRATNSAEEMITFSDLYERRAEYVYFLCTRLEMDPEKVELLHRDAWRRINRYLPQLDRSTEEKWLCRKLIDSHRKLQRTLRAGEDGSAMEGTSDQVRLGESLMKLGLEHRWPLVLRECAGFSYHDISWILSIPPGTVKARIAMARTRLHKFRAGGAA